MTSTWTVVVPVKRLPAAKSRLAVPDPRMRARLALAFAVDTVGTALAVPGVVRVVVVTDDSRARAALADLPGVLVVADLPSAGLNPALVHGAAHAVAGTGVVALSADLPAARPQEVGVALAALSLRAGRTAPLRGFVADATGTGTTLLAAVPGAVLSPAFGPRSRARHRASGALELDPPLVPGLRRDVDTEVDLWDAVRLGVGPATATALDDAVGPTTAGGPPWWPNP